MTEEDIQVQKALAEAGFGTWPASSRGELFDTLTRIRKGGLLAIEEFVDQQRQVLEKVASQEELAQFEQLRIQHPFLKACPECGHRPDFGPGYASADGDALVVCMNHPAGAVTQAGASVSEALERWNADDWLAPGLDRERFPL
ncbi:hypothetical protein [Pseudomonas fluorescens]|uniref:Uncharacterized protein n=1 Tax=Pseudomonas fluorescens TaxID=294 RepID=A0A2T0HMX3_PSEFL|nr:hypothetical protein [Pseudomonas fluorescens]PRW84431.1 hypothetical protein C7A10_28770 [Pseudomonas fluorescens]